MKTFVLENLTEEQKLVVDVLINEGKMRAFEDLISTFEKEYFRTATEDPYYGYYIKHIVDVLKEKLSGMQDEEA